MDWFSVGLLVAVWGASIILALFDKPQKTSGDEDQRTAEPGAASKSAV